MDEMRERIARALAVADGKDPDAPAWAHFTGGRVYPEGICWRDQYAAKADAVLEAMMEPTPEMLEDFGIHANRMKLNWQAMITAARSGSSGER